MDGESHDDPLGFGWGLRWWWTGQGSDSASRLQSAINIAQEGQTSTKSVNILAVYVCTYNCTDRIVLAGIFFPQFPLMLALAVPSRYPLQRVAATLGGPAFYDLLGQIAT